MKDGPSLTEQLRQFSGGEKQVAEVVLREVLPKLHQIAVRELKKERYVAPVSPTELIHEVWLRNLRKGGWQINSRDHFYAIAALAMRRVLVDFARGRLTLRRGDGEAPVPMEGRSIQSQDGTSDPEAIVQIGILMEKLEKVDNECARVVDMHYFAGFTLEEITEITGLTFRQVRHRWEKGRDWLKERLKGKEKK
ncbi:MAG TPA: ECF-type sigma factor [Candidatus Dormibacteraeota bacterium]|jgi:RNA polymerase sigma factor (TIGR02999 family)|nr:ECF-type sigma factor [Candidatus Dormibacteraeota bacterium]